MLSPNSSRRQRKGLWRKALWLVTASALTVMTTHGAIAQEDVQAQTPVLESQTPPPVQTPAAPAADQTPDASNPPPPTYGQRIVNTLPDSARPYQTVAGAGLSGADRDTLQQALNAVHSRNYAQADSLATQLTDPAARKIVIWAILNNGGNLYSFAALDAARRDLWGWPKDTSRQIAAEKMIGMSGMGPQQTVDWFNGSPPQTIEGATALINAYQSLGNTDAASHLAKTWWRTEIFDSLAQANFYSAFGRYLTQDDHKARINCLLINTQNGSSQAVRDMMSYVDDQTRLVANAALAMRGNSAGGDALYSQALAADPHNPILAFARAKYLAGKGLEPLGFGILADLPPASMSPDAASQLYLLRLDYFRAALKAHDYHAAYAAMNGGGFENGESKAEAEFFAGWVALVKLNDTNAAINHFTLLAEAGTSPITQGRANYWLGRAYEARNNPGLNGINPDITEAQNYYAKGGQYIYSFYGQLAAEKAGVKEIVLGKDPVPTQADRDRFNNRDMVKAARILGQMGETDYFRQIVLTLDTVLPNAEEEALLVDLTSTYDSQIMAMKVARMSMQRGFYLPERAYPVRDVPDVPAPEKAFVLAITRQESGFDPTVRSRANARGMMQLIPSTARAVARRLGAGYSDSKLYEPDFNMTLGAYHLGELVTRFDGSYIMAAAGYNAGPTRMSQWVADCGEPRGPNADSLSFIECMPLRETRDYMMRVTENMRVYRARLNGGHAPLTAMADVQRGLPAPIVTTPDDDAGDGSSGGLQDGPISYADYQKAQADNAALASSLQSIPAPPPAVKKTTSKSKKSSKAKSKKTSHSTAASSKKKKKHR
jgi:soluble lytic murein transglycosylase